MRYALLVVMLVACDDEEAELITRISSPRVIAIESEPSVLGVDGEVRLQAVTVDAAGPRASVDAVRIRACSPWRFIAEPALDCVGSDALTLIATDGAFAVSTAQLIEAFPPPEGNADVETLRAALAAGLRLRVPVVAEVEVDGETLVARRDMHVVEDASLFVDPRLAEVRFDGVATRALRSNQTYTLTLTFDPESIDDRPQDPEDEPELEEFDCYFYSPAGELAAHEVDVEEPDVPVPETEENEYTPGPPGETWLFLVITDSTGGMTAESIPLAIE
jgi:hypothetical protein